MIALKKWSGSFVADGHRYFTSDGRELQGVTGILSRRLFPNEYSGISGEVLKNAADRGTMIHSRCQLYDISGIGTDMPEVANYARLMNENNFEHIASEYLVSDDEHYASAVDKVYHIKGTPDNEVVIGDIKTTSKFNREKTSWQTSIYANWLEAMNPGVKVVGLVGIWLREDNTRGSIAKVIPLERKPESIVNELLRCDIEDREFSVNLLPDFITDNIDRLVFLNEQIKACTEEKEAIIKEIFEQMQKRQDKSIDSGVILFTRKEGGVRTTFDSAKFKAEHADMYNDYLKTSETKETLQLTIRSIQVSQV